MPSESELTAEEEADRQFWNKHFANKAAQREARNEYEKCMSCLRNYYKTYNINPSETAQLKGPILYRENSEPVIKSPRERELFASPRASTPTPRRVAKKKHASSAEGSMGGKSKRKYIRRKSKSRRLIF